MVFCRENKESEMAVKGALTGMRIVDLSQAHAGSRIARAAGEDWMIDDPKVCYH
jgi:hypothetical protein